MSPQFQDFKRLLSSISEREDTPIEIQFRQDNHNSTPDIICYILYLWYGGDKWEYHWIRLPMREQVLAEIEFNDFCDFMA